jgi:Mg-chelatase subunit ChlD
MTFQSPLYLLLLLVIPYFIWLANPKITVIARRMFLRRGNLPHERETASAIKPPRSDVSGREKLSLTLRLLLLLCLIFALAGFSIASTSEQLSVLYLLDISDSVSQAQQEEALTFIEQDIASKPPDDLAGLIVFGGNALVEIPLSKAPNIDGIRSIPATGQTDIGEALTLAQALFPSNTAKRIVLFSDGINTQGDVIEAVRIASTNGIDILTIPLATGTPSDVAITELDLPTQLFEGERFEMAFKLFASANAPATIRLLSGGEVISEESLQLDAGESAYTLPLVANQAGLQEFSIQVESPVDSVVQNNQLSGITFVSGPPKVLVAAVPAGTLLPNGDPRPDEVTPLLNALESGGFDYELTQPELIPSDPAQLAQYSSIVLVNVPRRSLNPAQMRSLQSYVRDLGGGLVAIGGPTSFGLGGYYRTPLEETLPVNMRNDDEVRRSTLTLVFVIDRSGSMSDSAGGPTKLALAREAVIRSVELLLPKDKVGVVAFDDAAEFVVPIQEVEDGAVISNTVSTLQDGGGTDIMIGLQTAADQLVADDAQVRHIILLTDGGADETGLAELAASLYQEHNITLTSIGVGSDAAAFLQDLASVGGGRYHFVTDPQSIPSIFTEETTLATQSYLVDETFTPLLGDASPIRSGISALPPLNGYITTSAKDAATLPLLTMYGDPLLAHWQYGLGRAVAFTSDASGGWAGNWVRWSGFAQFWGQVISYVTPPPTPSNVTLNVETAKGTTTLSVDARDEAGNALNGMDVIVNVVSNGNDVTQVTLTQVGAGLYQAKLDALAPLAPGAYAIGVSGTGEAGEFVERYGWAQSYSPEYQPSDERQSVLPEIEFSAPPSTTPEEIYAHNLRAQSALNPLWQELLTLAAFLLVLDIASRRLLLSQRDFVQAWGWLKARFAIQPKVAEVVETPTRLSSLQKAKERAQRDTVVEREEPLIIEKKVEEKKVAEKEGDASTVSSLLKRKRERRGED